MSTITSGDEGRLHGAVRGLLEKAIASTNTPGSVAGVSVAGDRIVSAYGLADIGRGWPITENSRFGSGCITKLLFGVVIACLVDEGVLSLDEPISESLIGSAANRGITVRHLLSHTAGYQGPLMFGVAHRSFSWETFAANFSGFSQVFEPGCVFNYENTGHVILGEHVRLRMGREVGDLITEFIFAPLKITPSTAFRDYNNPEYYVAPHQVDLPAAHAVAPVPFGRFWRSSLADITMSLHDFLTIGEAFVDPTGRLGAIMKKFAARRLIALPNCVSSARREHSPKFFNTICAEYAAGWYGYAGSSLGQTCGLRFCPESRSVCAVALNGWVPVVRDFLMDRLCGTQTHPESGQPGGNPGFSLSEMIGRYAGGGNIIRSVEVRQNTDNNIQFLFGSDGLRAEPLELGMTPRGELIPDLHSTMPGIGFFRDPNSGRPCLMIGASALRMAT